MTDKDVAVKGETALSTDVAEPEALKGDVLIPRLLLMQGQSEFVTQRKAMIGDMVRSINQEKLGDDTHPISFIPLALRNTWILQEMVGKKYEYRGVEPRTAKNDDLPWEFKHLGADWRRVKCIDCFSLLPQDIEAEAAELEKAIKGGTMPDLNKTLLPVLISFRSTSFNAGKAVATHFAKAQSMAKYGAKAYGYTLELRCKPSKNDKGEFFIFDVGQGSAVDKDALGKAEEWHGVLKTQTVRVDETMEDGKFSEPTGEEPAEEVC